MTIFQRWICGIASIIMMMFLFDLMRRRKLREEYTMLWLAACVTMLVMALHGNLVHWIGHILRTKHAAYSLFVFAFLVGIILAIHFTVVLSKLTAQNWRFAQEIGLLRAEIEELRKEQETQDT